MTIHPKISVFILGLLAAQAFALESVADDELSGAVGQDGITITTSMNWVSQSVRIHDTNGIPITPVAGYNNAGTLAINGLALQGCTNGVGVACTTTTNPTLRVLVDASGGAAPVMQIGINWDAAIAKIRFGIDNISIQNGLAGNAVEMVDVVQNYVDLIRPAGSPAINLELGNEPGGHMMTMAAMDLGVLDFGTVRIRDKCDATVCASGGTVNRNLRFDFRFGNTHAGVADAVYYNAADAYTFNLTGATVDVVPTGLVFAMSSVNNLAFIMGNVTAGNSATSMGSFGMKGISITNLSIRVAGKS